MADFDPHTGIINLAEKCGAYISERRPGSVGARAFGTCTLTFTPDQLAAFADRIRTHWQALQAAPEGEPR